MTAAAVSMAKVGKVFNPGGANRVEALRSIDLSIGVGEFVSLIGPSGCGKSTLLRLIGDLTVPTSGVLSVNGKTPHQARSEHDYAMVFQRATLLEWRNVAKNVQLPLEILKVDKQERERRATKYLDLVHLGDFADHYPWQLSGGMQQRVAIARGLVFDPALLLMDEPFGALDEMTRERMQMELMEIWRTTGKTIVFVTHSIPEAVFLSTRVVVMSPRPGRIAEIIDVGLPQPRVFETREAVAYYEKMTEVRVALRNTEVKPT